MFFVLSIIFIRKTYALRVDAMLVALLCITMFTKTNFSS